MYSICAGKYIKSADLLQITPRDRAKEVRKYKCLAAGLPAPVPMQISTPVLQSTAATANKSPPTSGGATMPETTTVDGAGAPPAAFFFVFLRATSRKAPDRQRGTPLRARHVPPEGGRVMIYQLKQTKA